jgi:hypothetical protein
MGLLRMIKRLLGATTIAAAGMVPDAARADDGDVTNDNDAVEADGDAPVSSVRERAVEAETSALDLTPRRVELLVDQWGPVEPALAAVLLGTALRATHPVERIALVCDWAASPSVVRRRALARALTDPFPCAGAITALDVLARDPDPAVRGAARQAILIRSQLQG